MVIVYLFVLLFLLFLNAFFVLAEFSSVKLRASRVEALIDAGRENAKVVQHIQEHLDEYLSVCQLGITFTSIGLGFIGEPAIAKAISPILAHFPPSQAFARTLSISISYVVVSFLHILVGELIPKSLAIRDPERSALHTARPMRVFRWFLYIPLISFNSLANLCIRMLGVKPLKAGEIHSEEELRIILGDYQEEGLMSFQRLLLLENIFDLAEVRVRDVMKPKTVVRGLNVDGTWADNFEIMRQTRFSRYPLLHSEQAKPLGFIHVKDILLRGFPDPEKANLRDFVRPYVSTQANTKVEDLLSQLQRQRAHVAMVFDEKKNWVGLITMEDIAEQIVGSVEDEFELETPVSLSEALSLNRIFLDLQSRTAEGAIRDLILRIPNVELPISSDEILRGVLEREKTAGTYLGRGLALPHARLKNITQPFLVFGRSEEGISWGGPQQKAYLILLLITPLSLPQLQVRILARIAKIMDSDYVEERLREAQSAQDILEAIRAAETAALN